jgi:hypothetical protein
VNYNETEELLIRASAIDNRNVTEITVTGWQQVLHDVSFENGVAGLIAHRRDRPGVYVEPGHILGQVKIAVAKRREIYGLHPKPPAGLRWAANAIDAGEIEQ